MITFNSFQNPSFQFFRATTVVAVLLITAVTGIAAPTAFAASQDAPTCTITVTPAMINGGQRAVLKWSSTAGAVFASIDNGIGNVSVDGLMIVTPKKTTVYTLHPWNSRGEGGYCATTITVDGVLATKLNLASSSTATAAQAPVLLSGSVAATTSANQPTVRVETIKVHPAATRVVLESVPYTGTAENILYTLFLLSLMMTAAYAATQRKQVLG